MYPQYAGNPGGGYRNPQPLLPGGIPLQGVHSGGGGMSPYMNAGMHFQQPLSTGSLQQSPLQQSPMQSFPPTADAQVAAFRALSHGVASPTMPLTAATQSPPARPPVAEVQPQRVMRQVSGPRHRDPTTECAIIDNNRMCNDDRCGGENTGPRKKVTRFGINEVWFRPIGLIGWTAASGLLMVFIILPAAAGSVPEVVLRAGRWAFGAVSALTFALELRVRFGDPGVMTEEEVARMQRQRDEEADEGGEPMPDRAHRCWYHPRPVLRYDHWCKWLHNAIGLRNHRAFFTMVTLLLLSSLCSAVADLLVVGMLGRSWLSGEPVTEGGVAALIAALGHVIISGGILYFVSDVWKIHVQQISRNELCKESEVGKYEVFPTSKKGPQTRRDELSSSEGWARNWLTFVCASRNSLGEF